MGSVLVSAFSHLPIFRDRLLPLCLAKIYIHEFDFSVMKYNSISIFVSVEKFSQLKLFRYL